MKRIGLGLAATYLLLAGTSKVLERRGVMRCGCSDACWCKKPVLSAFRWVAPYGHRGGTAEDKHEREHAPDSN